MSEKQDQPQVLNHREAALLLGISAGTLANWNTAGTGPDHFYEGRQLRYRREDLVGFSAAEVRTERAALRLENLEFRVSKLERQHAG